MFRDETVVITGASSGLGRSLAIEFARQGARLALFGRSKERLAETADRCREHDAAAVTVDGDITRPEDCARLIETAMGRFGTIDYLVLAAGVSMWARFEDIEDIGIFRKVMDTNYLGAVHCTHFALPHLKESAGMIVAISSIQGKIGVPYHTGYVASKHALQGFFDTLRAELEGTGVKVLMVLPHWLRGTRLRRNAYDKSGAALGDARRNHSSESIGLDECCREIMAAMRSGRRELVIPMKLRLLSWLNLISPRLVERIVKSKTEEQNK